MARKPKDTNIDIRQTARVFDEQAFVDGVFNDDYILVVGFCVIVFPKQYPNIEGVLTNKTHLFMAIIILQGCREIHYEVDTALKPIRVDSMGRVYKGRMVNESTGKMRPVAVEFMFDGLPTSAYERARREASIQLHHGNLIEMLEFIDTKESYETDCLKTHYYIVSELLEGVILSNLLKGDTTDYNGRNVPYAEYLLAMYHRNPELFAKTIVSNIISGLMTLHDAGYIHRDVSSSNIMITSDGHIKLINFGLVKRINSLAIDDNSLTTTGMFIGKSEYVAPELVLGDVEHQNQTTDIYAVGILLYQCITGHTPFDGQHHDILQKQLKEKMPLTAIKNKQLRYIIATACNKEQQLRYQSLNQMRMNLEIEQRPKTSGNSLISKVLAAPIAIIAAPISLATTGINSVVDAIKERKRQSKQHGISYRPVYNTYDTDLTYSSIFAPAEIKRKSHMQVQVYLHLFEETEKVKLLAQESQKNAERRDYIPLQCKLKRGDKVDVLLSIYGETLLKSEKKSVVWQGHFTKCSFDYFVPKDIDVDELSCVALLTVNEIPAGEMRFTTKIVEQPRRLNPEIIAHKYNKVFISYSHKDEPKVKFLHEGLAMGGVPHFFDRSYLKPGDIFPKVIQDYINSADLFVLCWSENAAQSEYVKKERIQALERAYPKVQDGKLLIYPMSIEPRAELPSDMKDNYHFGEI